MLEKLYYVLPGHPPPNYIPQEGPKYIPFPEALMHIKLGGAPASLKSSVVAHCVGQVRP